MALIKKLSKQGNSYSLIIDKALIELLDIDAETPLQLSTKDGVSLIVTPIRDELVEKSVQQKLKHFKKKYGRALKRLAE